MNGVKIRFTIIFVLLVLILSNICIFNANAETSDYNVSKIYYLSKYDLPKNIVLLNKLLSSAEIPLSAYPYILLASILIFALICFLLAALVMLAKKNKSLLMSQSTPHSAEELLEKEIQLRESKELLEKVIQIAPLVYIFSVDDIIINTNSYAQDQLDIHCGDEIKKIYYDLGERKELLNRLEIDNFIAGEIIMFRTKDLDRTRFLINISKLEYGGKKAYIIWGFNIESREYQKDSLTKAHKDMQKLLKALPIPLVILNPEVFKLIYANNSFMSMFHQEPTDDFEKIDVTKFLPETQPNGEKSLDVITKIMKQSIELSVPVVEDIQHLLESNETIDMKTMCETISYNGMNSIIVIMQDISAEKRQSEMLKNTAEKEKEANQLKNRFIINMSHEIRTPMNAIIGLSEIEMSKLHSKETYETYRKINSSAKNLLTIVNDILDFSKMEAQKMDIVEDIFELEEVVSNAMTVASQRLDDKPIEMLIDIDCNLPVTLIGDKVRLWQILKNFLDNSAKYTLKGNITLTARAINKNAIENIFIKFKISDTGLGINQSSLEKLFTPFEQFHQNEIRIQGTGLGMVISRQLAELMGGKVSVESEYGVGTVITVILPFKVAKPVLSIKNNCNREELNRKRILIVDDNPLIIDILSSLLEELDILSDSASNSKEAYEKIVYKEKDNMPYDVILLDYLLRDETCLDLAIKIRSMPGCKSKLILLSAYSKRLLTSEIKNYGFVEVIEKPFVPTSFVQKICLALNINMKTKKVNTRMNFENANVLLCEDNIVNQEVAKGLLGMCNIIPTIAENGQEAINLLKRQEFHLVLMDILMPVMDGHQATVKIRNSNTAYANVPIVAMTANVMKDEVEKCKAEGMNGHIPKPIDFEKLYEQLLKWIPHECRVYAQDTPQYVIESNETIIDGIDMAQGIARFGGNRERYINALYKFAVSFEGVDEPFEEIISAEKMEHTKNQIHTIKGVSGNLGLTPIYMTACAFEESLLSGNPDEMLYGELQNICAKTNKSIIESFSPENNQKKLLQTATVKEQTELLQNLGNALQSFDPESADKCIAHLKSKRWGGIDEKMLSKLYNDIESYNFEGALDILSELGNRIIDECEGI